MLKIDIGLVGTTAYIFIILIQHIHNA